MALIASLVLFSTHALLHKIIEKFDHADEIEETQLSDPLDADWSAMGGNTFLAKGVTPVVAFTFLNTVDIKIEENLKQKLAERDFEIEIQGMTATYNNESGFIYDTARKIGASEIQSSIESSNNNQSYFCNIAEDAFDKSQILLIEISKALSQSKDVENFLTPNLSNTDSPVFNERRSKQYAVDTETDRYLTEKISELNDIVDEITSISEKFVSTQGTWRKDDWIRVARELSIDEQEIGKAKEARRIQFIDNKIAISRIALVRNIAEFLPGINSQNYVEIFAAITEKEITRTGENIKTINKRLSNIRNDTKNVDFNSIDRAKIQIGDVIAISQRIDDALKIINVGAAVIEQKREEPRFAEILKTVNDLYEEISNMRVSVKKSQLVYADIKLKFESPLLYWVKIITKPHSHDI